ncbi:MAG: polyketide-type polyunsaturated fatty acid synthase PfaA, partial [Myxococcota bacterium]
MKTRNEAQSQMSNTKTPAIAVVGASALFPGATDGAGFWRNILAGNDLITDVPSTHWLIDDYYDPDPKAKDKTYAKRGAFLPKVDFDALGFGVPPSIIPATDTAQLLALIVAQRVLNDAAQGQFETLDRDKISVILGVTSAQELLGSMVARLQRPVWEKALRDAGLPESQVVDCCERISNEYTPWQESTFPGVLGNVVAGRIANRFDLGGTNCVTDAACASTFSAISMAVNELYLGQSDMVITGGVDTMNDIFMYMCFSKTPALSRTGDCRPFSDKADGTMLGEGLGMVALKRLEDAERDGDRVYAVLHGVGSSSDGRAKSVYAPVPKGQSKALKRAYERAGYSCSTVELVEGHGTGTVAGDAAEFEGLTLGFASEEGAGGGSQWCALGSVKSQIGHTKAAAGAAGLFKVVMALQHKVLPPTIKVDRPNPNMDLENSPFYLNLTSRPWVRSSDHPRRGSISSFGFGGSNFHLALEEYTGANPALKKRSCDTELVVLGADTPQALVAALRGLEVPEDALRFVAHSTQSAFDKSARARVGISASNEADLSRKLKLAADKIAADGNAAFSAPGVHYANAAEPGKTAFLFPGQGSQYLAMGAGPAMTWDSALGAWDLSADITMDPTLPLHEVVFPKSVFGDAAKQAQADRLVATQWAQPAIGAASLSTLRLLQSLGLEADCLGGHSFGEVTALHAAGAFDAETMLKIARKRGELMQAAAATPGSMTAVTADIEAVRTVLASSQADVVVANHNGPMQVVLSGETTQIAAAEKALESAGLRFKRLTVATAFHSKVVADSAAPFAEFLAGIDLAAPTHTVYANSLAAPYPADATETRAILSGAVAAPVRFVEQIQAMWDAGVRTFVEVGPGSVLTGLVGKILADKAHHAISTDRKGAGGVGAFHDALAQLVVAGLNPELLTLWAGFDIQVDPAKAPKPKLAVAMDGSNVDKPYPPVASKRPGPNPERTPEVIIKEVEVIREVEVIKEVAVPVPMAASGAAPTQDDAWLSAYQETQRQTAETHAVWQQAMSDTHLAFLAGVEQSFQGLTATLAGQPATAQVVQAAPALLAPTYATPPAPQPARVVVAAPAPVPVSAPVAITAPVLAVPPTLDLTGLLLSVVADKTGYPADMLDLSMSLESDLGIDSIKRVEILAAMTEQAPELPEVDTTEMARLATLQEIVDYMGSTLPQATAAPLATAAPAIDLTGLLLSVVAEKTGYPADMLDLSMSLESDLGIDSIKRVEILAAMTEQAPELPEVDTAEMARLATLQ